MTKLDFCSLLGINRNSKYFEYAVDNGKTYKVFLSLEGYIILGEKVRCGASPEAIVTAIKSNCSVTVQLLTFGNKKRFDSLSAGKVRRYEPDIQLYDRQTRFDTTPVYITRNIEDFYCRHVPLSPNKSNLVKRRYLLHPAQFDKKQAMLRYQTMNELWDLFIQNTKLPNTAPVLFRNNAPWEMRKAQDLVASARVQKLSHFLP